MRKVRKKNILDRIDDSINDKIDEIKMKKDTPKNETKNTPVNKKKPVSKNASYNYPYKKKKVSKPTEFNEIDDFDELKSDYKEEYHDKETKTISSKNNNKKSKIYDYEKDKVSDEDIEDKIDELLKVDKISDNDLDSNEVKKKKKYKFVFGKKNKDTLEDKKATQVTKKNKQSAKLKDDSNQNVKPKKKKRSLWKKIVTFILILGIIGVLSVTGFLAYIVATAPEFNEADLAIKDQTVIYDVNGDIIAKLGTEKRESITYEDIPQVLIDAIIATEDSRFFQHNGVDLFRFIKATIQQLLGQDSAGGASTLTMQTVKNNLTKKDSVETTNTLEDKLKKVIRKFQDVYLAVFKVEKEYSKEEILEMYINDNGLGSSYYGVEEASKYYFGKSASDLTLPEASLIAGLFQAPNRHNPYKDIDSATKRRNTVLTLMERHGYITKEERELAEKVSIESLLVGANNSSNPYQGYIDTVVQEVEKITDRGDGTGGDNPYTVPMKIYTTMERWTQDGVNAILNDNTAGYWKDANATAGVAIINVETGGIAAVGGGRNKEGERLFNNATQAHRQPGSTAKPLFDYGPGIEYNNFSSYQLFNDEPWGYTGGPAVNNWDNSYQGLITMRQALKVSRNVPALKAFQQVGPVNVQKFVSSIGLNVSLNANSENYTVFSNGLDNTINEAYAIGGAAEGYTPLQMAAAYSTFASGGYYIEPHSVTKIVYRETNEEKEFKYAKERVMKDSTAYIMNNILESAVSGGGFNGGALVPGSHVAAKTGTSNFDQATMRANNLPGSAVNDLWTVAYTSKYTIGVWYGYEKISDGYNTEGGYKDMLTATVMRYIPVDSVGWSMPSSVVAVTVEKDTWPAMLPSAYTPGDMMLTEYFVRGTQPTEVSPRYQKINDVKNVTTSKVNSNNVTIRWDYDTPTVLTESYLQSYFNNSVYGNQKGGYLEARRNYNNGVLGPIRFYIYQRTSSGSLALIDSTTDTSYTYTGYGNTTLVIRAEHANFKANAADGVTVNIKLDELSNDKLVVTLNGQTNMQRNVGTYTESGIKSITYSNMDITNNKNVSVKYIIAHDSENHEFDKPSDLEEYVNTLSAGTYKINYVVTYLGISVTKTRTVTLR